MCYPYLLKKAKKINSLKILKYYALFEQFSKFFFSFNIPSSKPTKI